MTEVLLAAGLLGLAPFPSQQAPVFAGGVEAVYLDVFVTSRGEPVTGLRAEDFEVRDEGVVQEPSLVDLETIGVTAVLAFDTSGSVTGDKLTSLRAAGHAFVEGLTDRDQAALLTFSQKVNLELPPTRDRAALHQALDRLAGRGATSIWDALYLALELPWGSGRPMLVVFTDGEDNLSWLGPEDLLRAARETDVLVDVVASEEPKNGGVQLSAGLPRWPASAPAQPESDRRRTLRLVAETTGGAMWTANTSTLKDRFLEVLGGMRARYLLAYEPRGSARAGRHRLKVSVKGRHLDVRTRPEYTIR